jgi:hypothetical protein
MIRFLESVFATARFFLVTADVFFFFLGSSTSRWTFDGLHCVHLPAPTLVRDYEQLTMSGTEATGALSMGPSVGYISILKLVKFNLIFAMISMLFMNIFAANLSSSKITHVHILVITNLLLFFWINFNMIMPKFLTYCARSLSRHYSLVNGAMSFLTHHFLEWFKVCQSGLPTKVCKFVSLGQHQYLVLVFE